MDSHENVYKKNLAYNKLYPVLMRREQERLGYLTNSDSFFSYENYNADRYYRPDGRSSGNEVRALTNAIRHFDVSEVVNRTTPRLKMLRRLGLEPDATREEIERESRYKLSITVHPKDRAALQEAYEYLTSDESLNVIRNRNANNSIHSMPSELLEAFARGRQERQRQESSGRTYTSPLLPGVPFNQWLPNGSTTTVVIENLRKIGSNETFGLLSGIQDIVRTTTTTVVKSVEFSLDDEGRLLVRNKTNTTRKVQTKDLKTGIVMANGFDDGSNHEDSSDDDMPDAEDASGSTGTGNV